MDFASEVVRDLLRAYPASATVYPVVGSCGSWNLSTGGTRRCAFHLVTGGSCSLQLSAERPTLLDAGDLVLFARGVWHELSGPGLTCGYIEFHGPRSNLVVDALPDVIFVRAHDQSDRDRTEGLVRLLAAEARAGAPDTLVRDSVAELLFAIVLRAHLEGPEEKRGFLAALAEPRIGRALAAIHREPEHDWRLETLAEQAGMSRTAFAESFAELLGVPPMHYVAQWRMRRAASLLRDPRNSVASVAAQLGYRSEAAFRRAYKRLEGISPGRAGTRAPR